MDGKGDDLRSNMYHNLLFQCEAEIIVFQVKLNSIGDVLNVFFIVFFRLHGPSGLFVHDQCCVLPGAADTCADYSEAGADVPGGCSRRMEINKTSYCFRINNLVSDPAPSFCPQQHGFCHLMKSPSTWLGTWREVPSATLLLPWNQSRGSPSRPLYMSLAAWQEVIYELFS